MKLIQDERVSRQAVLRPAASAIIFNSGNGRWSLPGGVMAPGESAEETCVREVIFANHFANELNTSVTRQHVSYKSGSYA